MSLKIGEILIKRGFITPEQLARGVEVQKNTPFIPLGQILTQLGFLTRETLNLSLDSHRKRLPLGEVLIRKNILDRRMIDHALAISKKEMVPLGRVLINLRYLQEDHLAQAIADQYDLPFMPLQNRQFSPDLGQFLNPNYALKHKAVVVARQGQTITLAMAVPLPHHILRELEIANQVVIEPVVASETDIVHAQERIYGTSRRMLASTAAEEVHLDLSDPLQSQEGHSKYVLDYKVDHLLKKLLATGVSTGASDIHLENTEGGMKVRFRIDGVLQLINLGGEGQKISISGSSIVSKTKILCDLDITERRRPQDGSFRIKVASGGHTRNVDFRVSTVPTRLGENLVIRILDKIGPMTLASCGFASDQIVAIEELLQKPTGIFLVTGPTGSGKSSTLYAMLGHLNRPGVKILTVEDPIEYSIEGISQSEANEAIGNTFAEFLRAFLRQDPDHIMVGEIRDLETASIAVRASLTGHTVLSTLHTNDATGAVSRLIDMGLEPSLVASTLRCVIAQRLIRINCKYCRAPYEPTEEAQRLFPLIKQEETLLRGKGCPHCHFSGFSGRKPIIEMWAPTRDEALLINARTENAGLRETVFLSGRRQTMLENGLERIHRGETTIEEILRVVPFEQVEEHLIRYQAKIGGREALSLPAEDQRLPLSADKRINDRI